MAVVPPRRARVEDAYAIARVHVESWRATYPGLVPDRFLAAMRVDEYTERWHRMLAGRSGGHVTFVVEEAGRVVGFASGGREREDRPRRGELYAIYLLPEARGRGHGRALVRAVAASLRDQGLTSLIVWVLRDNHPARAFYEHLGGTYAGERPLDFGAGFTLTEVGYAWPDTDRLLGDRAADP
ncbi:MAG TPA: GNAT family N-acetyltransferase [Candidatus Dormibacteraeota bacterium]|jgi:ribosomal protein S18 acetylase RimI-like enzyme|nr:GNAT family N-acetyltransferase [Candidatus Dormibacteraeota bacterium]